MNENSHQSHGFVFFEAQIVEFINFVIDEFEFEFV